MENIRCQSCFQEYTGALCPHCGGAQNQSHQLPVGTLLQGRYQLGMVQEQSDMDITYLAWDTRTNTSATVKEFFLRGVTQRREGSPLTTYTSFTSAGLAAQYKTAMARFLGDAPEHLGENGTFYTLRRQICDMTLEEYLLSKGGTLSVEETLQLLEPVMQTLTQAHEQGSFHGDIGMDSIIIGADGTVRIQAPRKAPKTGELAPKHGYAPIERYSPRDICGAWSDVYGICAVIWHCLTGQPMNDAVYRGVKGPEPDWRIIPELSKMRQRILRKGASLRPANRYPTVKELATELYRKFSIVTEEAIGAGHRHSVRLKADGTVVAIGSKDFAQCNVQKWESVTAVSAGDSHTVGAKIDGTVVAVGSNFYGQCEVKEWTDIKAVSAGGSHTVGIKSDGTVVATGWNHHGQCNTGKWTDITDVSAGSTHTVGLKKDGTVVAVGSNFYGQCDVERWVDITAVSAGGSHTVGLKKNGTVVTAGQAHNGQRKTQDWKDIVAISAGRSHTVGLRSDGTVIAVGSNESGQCNVESWTDIVAISTGTTHTLGLRADGTVVAAGGENMNMCDTKVLSGA